MSDVLIPIKEGKQIHKCPWLQAARHIEQFDYYHNEDNILVKPCCSLRPKNPRDFQLDTGTAERSISRMTDQFDQGQWPSECSVCFREEKDGMISERLRGFELNFHKQEIIAVKEIHLKFSNFCNLACRVCNTTESTTYGKILAAEDSAVFTQKDISEHRHWWILLDYIEKLFSKSSEIHLCMVGGETTLAPGFLILGQWLIDKGFIDRVKLVVSSNMLQMPDRLLDLFALSASTHISASLDSTHDNFHYVRWPGTWNKATQTVKKILDYRSQHGTKIYLQITPNFNINNIFYFDDFLDYWNEHEYDTVQVFNVYAPSIFRVDTIPEYIRPYLLERLRNCLDHDFFQSGKDTTNLVRSWLLTTIDRLEDLTNASPLLWDRYLAINAEFDHITKTSLFIHNSRLAQLLSMQDRDYYIRCLESAESNRLTKTPALLWSDTAHKWNEIPIRIQE